MSSGTLFEDLAEVRRRLATLPLATSAEAAIEPLGRAVEILRSCPVLDPLERERIAVEVMGIGKLLDGVGGWLAGRGVLTATYNSHAELETYAWGGRAGLAVEG